jgi:hypothetical protein
LPSRISQPRVHFSRWKIKDELPEGKLSWRQYPTTTFDDPSAQSLVAPFAAQPLHGTQLAAIKHLGGHQVLIFPPGQATEVVFPEQGFQESRQAGALLCLGSRSWHE